MIRDLAACNNYNCEMYRFNKCKRALRHKQAITNREQFVNYKVNERNCVACELYIPNENEKVNNFKDQV